jgi:hypothetical protein
MPTALTKLLPGAKLIFSGFQSTAAAKQNAPGQAAAVRNRVMGAKSTAQLVGS